MLFKYKQIIIGSLLLLLVLGLFYSIFQPDNLSEDHYSRVKSTEKVSDEFEAGPDLVVEALRGDISLLRDQLALLQQQFLEKSTIDTQANTRSTSLASNQDSEKNQEINEQVSRYDQQLIEQQKREENRVIMEEKIFTLENKLVSEEQDIAWSTQVESQIVDAINAIESSTASVLTVECRSTLCKLEVTSGDMDSSEIRAELIPKIGHILPKGTMREVVQQDGQKKLEFYMAREGYKLTD